MEGTKPKKQLTDKQRAGLAKGLEALRAKREAMKKQKETEEISSVEDVEESQKEVPVPKPVDYVPMSEFHKFKDDLLSTLQKPVQSSAPPVIPIQPPVPAPLPPITKVVSGSELLDRIFFR